MKLGCILEHLESIAPLDLAESWDNVGLLVGDRDSEIHSAMCCLTVTETTVHEAIERGVGLLISHHPIPFKPLPKITTDTITGRLLLQAIRSGIAIYSPHTAWDNAASGINQQLAEHLELVGVKPLVPSVRPIFVSKNLGTGRCGEVRDAVTVNELMQRLGARIPIQGFRANCPVDRAIKKVGIVCGSGGSLLSLVASNQCDAMLTGEATYHQCLEAEALGIAMLMIGHHASESFAMKRLSEMIQQEFSEISVIASEREFSPF